jgi:hypothetical protein
VETGTDTTYGTATVPANNYWYWNGYGYLYYGNVAGLNRDTTYHYQYFATVNGTTYYGGDQTFATSHDDAPTANNETFYEPTKPALPITLDIVAGDTLGNPTDTLTITGFSHPAGGELEIIDNGTMLLYTPTSRYSGNDSFTYTISDGYGATETGTVYIRNPYLYYAGNYQGVYNGSEPGYLTVTLGTQGAFTGSLQTLGGVYKFKGSLNAAGTAVLTLSSGKLPSLTLDLSLDFINEGGFSFAVNGPGGSSESGSFTQKVLFSVSNPAPETGKYTIIIPPPAAGYTRQATASAILTAGKVTSIVMTDDGAGYASTPTVTMTGATGSGAAGHAVINGNGQVTGITVSSKGSKYTNPVVTIGPAFGAPQGTGWATMTVTVSGAVTMTGKLGDGTPFTAGSWIDEDYYYYYYYGYNGPESFPVYANVYAAPAGYILGTMTFEDNPDMSDFDGGLSWYKPEQTTAQIFNGGFDLSVTMLGSVYVDPTNDYLLDLPSISGNALLSLTGGNLGTELENIVTIPQTPQTGVTVVSGSPDSLIMTSAPSTGAFTGKFSPTGANPNTSFGGVYFQKQNLGLGVFTGATQSGTVNITPQ